MQPTALTLTSLFATCLLLMGCQSTLPPQNDLAASAVADWQLWKAKRQESIAGTNGWLTLIGRHWLEQGPQSVGRNPSNDIVIRSERAPESIGVLHRSRKSVRIELSHGVQAWVEGQPAPSSLELRSDQASSPTLLVISDLKFLIIDRGERIGLRVRDPWAPARKRFAGLSYFPYQPDWRVSGTFETYPKPRSVAIDTVIGTTENFVSPGMVHFHWSGRPYSLEVVEEEGVDDFFVLFKDRTNGRSTYDAGRFLYVRRPDATGQVIIDFNRAYTPPCGFTPYATCPLAPRQNWLPVSIRAGEKAPTHQGAH